jgi:hypothetical protein
MRSSKTCLSAFPVVAFNLLDHRRTAMEAAAYVSCNDATIAYCWSMRSHETVLRPPGDTTDALILPIWLMSLYSSGDGSNQATVTS